VAEESDERAGSELLEALSARTRAGERIARRLGERRWGTVGGARREKLFERLGLANPWDPDAPTEPPVAMGPVALKLTDRRQPAPHAKPPSRTSEKKKKEMSPSDFRPKGIPKAPKKPAPRAAAPKPAPPPPIAELPQAEVESPDELADRMPPLPEKPSGRSKTGRVRMAPRTRARAPVFKAKPSEPDATEGSEVAPEVPAVPAAPEPPPVRREPPPGGNMGLDDLFGFSAGPTRVKIQRQKKKTLELPPEDVED